MTGPVVVDLFAGPGGWSEGLRMLGLSEVGVEWDDVACATARAAGHERVQADVAALNPADFPCDGLIASPPCQAWSMAGKGGGRRDVEHVIACARDLAAGNDTRADHAARCEDDRSLLVVEPLRWALALRPTWVALEQVPPVLELWKLFAHLLERHGYRTWAGVLSAEMFGVPQTRRRAILMARRDRPVGPPRPTHQRYVLGEPQRHDFTLEGEVLPWVSMAEALGWGMAARPSVPTHYDPRQNGARPRPVEEPAPTMQSQGLLKGRDTWIEDNGDGRYCKDSRLPAFHGDRMLVEGDQMGGDDWPERRPATVIAGDPRVFQPGGHHQKGEQSHNAVRVTVTEAAILQSFRPDYPWQGSRTKQFQQVGDAVPPLLARAILSQLIDPRVK